MKDLHNKLHIVSWLLKDAFWCLQLTLPAILMIFPTLGLMVYMLIKNPEERLQNATLSSWILMNILWMLHELPTRWPKWPVLIPMALGTTLSALLLWKLWEGRKGQGSPQ
jgi:hypothetical protein